MTHPPAPPRIGNPPRGPPFRGPPGMGPPGMGPPGMGPPGMGNQKGMGPRPSMSGAPPRPPVPAPKVPTTRNSPPSRRESGIHDDGPRGSPPDSTQIDKTPTTMNRVQHSGSFASQGHGTQPPEHRQQPGPMHDMLNSGTPHYGHPQDAEPMSNVPNPTPRSEVDMPPPLKPVENHHKDNSSNREPLISHPPPNVNGPQIDKSLESFRRESATSMNPSVGPPQSPDDARNQNHYVDPSAIPRPRTDRLGMAHESEQQPLTTDRIDRRCPPSPATGAKVVRHTKHDIKELKERVEQLSVESKEHVKIIQEQMAEMKECIVDIQHLQEEVAQAMVALKSEVIEVMDVVSDLPKVIETMKLMRDDHLATMNKLFAAIPMEAITVEDGENDQTKETENADAVASPSKQTDEQAMQLDFNLELEPPNFANSQSEPTIPEFDDSVIVKEPGQIPTPTDVQQHQQHQASPAYQQPSPNQMPPPMTPQMQSPAPAMPVPQIQHQHQTHAQSPPIVQQQHMKQQQQQQQLRSPQQDHTIPHHQDHTIPHHQDHTIPHHQDHGMHYSAQMSYPNNSNSPPQMTHPADQYSMHQNHHQYNQFNHHPQRNQFESPPSGPPFGGPDMTGNNRYNL